MRIWLALIAVMMLARSRQAVALGQESRPNIVFILADDLGWTDLGCYGSTFYETPNLDRLARQGVKFTRAYAACCVCSPTRASIMTGKYPARLGLTDWLPGQPPRANQKLLGPKLPDHLPLEEFTIAEALKQGGYATCFIGKWHLGGDGFTPDKQGFDINIGGCGLGHPPSYFSPYKIPTLTDGPKGEYLTDRLTDEAIKFIDGAKDKPFLLYLAHYAVHNPQQAKREMIQKYKAKLASMPKAARDEFAEDSGRKVRQVQDQPVYAAMVQSLDESVGRVMARLDELGLSKNTIVIFTSDNGGLSTAEGTPTSNLPLRCGKGWPYEGGIREPLIVSWPGVTKPASTCDQSMISTDYYPTLLEMAGLPLRPAQHLDGISIVPLIRGESMPQRPLFWHYPHYSNQGGGPVGTVMLGDFKLVEWFDGMRCELFNVREDIGEKDDLAAKMPDKVAALRGQLHDWRKSVAARMPTPNPNYNSSGAKRGPQQKAEGQAPADLPVAASGNQVPLDFLDD
jgi:arylsulfatase A-like enzyme